MAVCLHTWVDGCGLKEEWVGLLTLDVVCVCVCMCVCTSLCTFESLDLHIPEIVHDYNYMLSIPQHIYVHVFLCMTVAEKVSANMQMCV